MKHFGWGGKIWNQNIIPGILTWTSNKFIGIQRIEYNLGKMKSVGMWIYSKGLQPVG